MIYLNSFELSDKKVNDPNIYPYNVFCGKEIRRFVFSEITVLYGNNGSGKSTILNLIANKPKLKGKEYSDIAIDFSENTYFGIVDYCGRFSAECSYELGQNEETGKLVRKLPDNSRFIKSEDILYEVKKIEQKNVLADGMVYDYVNKGMTKESAKAFLATKEGSKQMDYILFAQEKYSNGETAMQIFEEYLRPDALYLLDEPEVSLSPANQVMLAEEIVKMSRYLDCQFIIATHSPFMLGTLDSKIYNIDKPDCRVMQWYELENIRYFYNFFQKHKAAFEED